MRQKPTPPVYGATRGAFKKQPKQPFRAEFQSNLMFLTSMELAVLRSLANGERSKRIADALGRSEATIEMCIKDLSLKLRARTRAHLVMIALEEGLISHHDIEKTTPQ